MACVCGLDIGVLLWKYSSSLMHLSSVTKVLQHLRIMERENKVHLFCNFFLEHKFSVDTCSGLPPYEIILKSLVFLILLFFTFLTSQYTSQAFVLSSNNLHIFRWMPIY